MKSLKNSKKFKLHSKKTKKVNKVKKGGGGGIMTSIKNAWNHRPTYHGSRLEKGLNNTIISFGKSVIHVGQPSSQVVKSAKRVLKDLPFTREPIFKTYYKSLPKKEKENLISALFSKRNNNIKHLKDLIPNNPTLMADLRNVIFKKEKSLTNKVSFIQNSIKELNPNKHSSHIRRLMRNEATLMNKVSKLKITREQLPSTTTLISI
jgi:hypothetical protein